MPNQLILGLLITLCLHCFSSDHGVPNLSNHPETAPSGQVYLDSMSSLNQGLTQNGEALTTGDSCAPEGYDSYEDCRPNCGSGRVCIRGFRSRCWFCN